VAAPDPLVVLASGGADSAILVADQSAQGQVVQPLYVRFGLAWEQVEEAHLRAFLQSLADNGDVRPLATLDLPVADIYGTHWSLQGDGVPDENTSDEAVYLPGRNLLLLAKTAVWCSLHHVQRIALGTLRANPFADSSRAFLSGFASLAGLALDDRFDVLTPFAGFTKAEVLALGKDFPLEQTFSCISPVGTKHCGRCNKCAERRKGFAEAGINDRTSYASD
jgi:7-cyano-7-deazaguanine synthase